MIAEYAANDSLEMDETVSYMQFTNAPPQHTLTGVSKQWEKLAG
jgi:hypothetical protein